MKRRSVAGTLLLLAVAGGCGAPTPVGTTTPGAGAPTASRDPYASRLPSRPREVALDGRDPCATFTAVQLRTLGVGGADPSIGGDGSPTCQWGRFPAEPRDNYLVELVTRQGAGYALDPTVGARLVDVAGFGTVETQREGAPPDRHCLLLVDVAAGENLWVQYDYDGTTVPMTKQRACQMAHTAAEMAVATLSAAPS